MIQQTAVQTLNKNDGLDGLTSKQAMFAALSFSGLSDVQAYRQAYDCTDMNDETASKEAWRVRHHPKIAAKLRELQDRRDAQTSLAPVLTREFILQGIMGIATSKQKDVKPNVQLAAYIALGKVAGIDLFRDVTRVERVERTVAEIDAELKERLRALQPVIDGDATQVSDHLVKSNDRRRKPRP